MSHIDAAIARAFAHYPDADRLAACASAVVKDRTAIVAMLQRRAKSIDNAETKSLLGDIAKEITSLPYDR